MGAAIFGLCLVGIIIAFVAISASNAKDRRVRWLAEAAQLLGGEHDGSNKAWGTQLGPKVTYELATRGAGSSAESWTHIHVQIPKKYPLAVHIRRQGKQDHSLVARGEMVDVLVGDKAFDDRFLVEAAPADVVRLLVDAEVRRLLCSYDDIDLDCVDRADGTRALVLGIRGWIETPALYTEPVQIMARLGQRVRDAYAAADADLQSGAESGDPYRPVADDQPARAAQVSREAEVERVKGLRAKRDARANALAWTIIGVVFGVILLSVCATLPR